MSIREQVKELRESIRTYENACIYNPSVLIRQISEAAGTIEALSAKLENMERSEDYVGWIPASERMPEEERCIDPETGYYGRSDDVLCSAYNEYEMQYETWIDHTIDGEWQSHEYDEEEKLAWMPLPAPYGNPHHEP